MTAFLLWQVLSVAVVVLWFGGRKINPEIVK